MREIFFLSFFLKKKRVKKDMNLSFAPYRKDRQHSNRNKSNKFSPDTGPEIEGNSQARY